MKRLIDIGKFLSNVAVHILNVEMNCEVKRVDVLLEGLVYLVFIDVFAEFLVDGWVTRHDLLDSDDWSGKEALGIASHILNVVAVYDLIFG